MAFASLFNGPRETLIGRKTKSLGTGQTKGGRCWGSMGGSSGGGRTLVKVALAWGGALLHQHATARHFFFEHNLMPRCYTKIFRQQAIVLYLTTYVAFDLYS